MTVIGVAIPSSRQPRPAGAAASFLFERVKNFFKIAAATGIALTLLYILILVMPSVIRNKAGSPVFENAPEINNLILVAHALTAIPPLVIGLAALSRRCRKASLRVHRWIGTAYCVSIWISAVLGGALALANTHGLLAKAGFFLLAIAWFSTTWFAYKSGRARDIFSHRRWMLRSYALTLAVVTVRPIFFHGPFEGWNYDDWYALLTWICWTPNLILAEFYIRITTASGALQAPRRKSRSGISAAVSSA